MEVDMIAKAFNDMVFFHAFFMAFFPIPFLINLYTLFTYKTYQKVIIKLWFVMPIIFLLVAVGSFSGVFILASRQWYMTWQIGAMIALTLLIFLMEIKRIKRLKLARTSEELMRKYITFCKWVYGIELCLVLLFSLRIIV
ncbi:MULTISPECIES: hypothetical protein [Helicobacter]|uniref:TerC family integral membrane protein n=3 Tax=Helicobacter TaxID=209 RepID=A0A377J385_9HELI|nr:MULTISPECIES: hypothetical protein [Helicobacter]MDL0079376.1 hypothetical protein [Helicobacter sp. CPD2-1]MDL0081405.1 hypothetical protein [Helicobacter sp. XJK30-2]STO96910.1 TerC family integral membrane protein [Helicobacter canis]